MSTANDEPIQEDIEPEGVDVQTEESVEEKKQARRQSQKRDIIQSLFNELWPKDNEEPDGPVIAYQDDIKKHINEYNDRNGLPKTVDGKAIKKLSADNPANFLKDFIRKRTCNDNWPKELKEKSITGRQRYGGKQVFEFVRYKEGDKVPFPDRFDPTSRTKVYPFESLSIPREARALGRADEPWLIQVVVSQKVLYHHLSVEFKSKEIVFEDLTHLQMSVKTQPEIDATFVATLTVLQKNGQRKELRVYITAEAKQFNERILEDQLREQVAQAFKITSALSGKYAVDAVIPMAFKSESIFKKSDDTNYSSVDMRKNNESNARKAVRNQRRGIYVAQFEMITREDFKNKYIQNLHEMPLILQSSAFYEPYPPIKGISFLAGPKPIK